MYISSEEYVEANLLVDFPPIMAGYKNASEEVDCGSAC